MEKNKLVWNNKNCDFNNDELIEILASEGIKERFGFDADSANLNDEQKEIVKRLRFEIEYFYENDLSGYILIVRDAIYWARDNKIPIGRGNGSLSSSILAYIFSITDINPLKYDLDFAVFAKNPFYEIDVCDIRKVELENYIYEKYEIGRKELEESPISFNANSALTIIGFITDKTNYIFPTDIDIFDKYKDYTFIEKEYIISDLITMYQLEFLKENYPKEYWEECEDYILRTSNLAILNARYKKQQKESKKGEVK